MISTPIPSDYTYLNREIFLSVKAKVLVMDLAEQATKRDPHLFGMNIYTDFYPYATLDLFHKTLSSLHTKVCKRDYDGAWPIAEALTHFFNLENEFTDCDDGELVDLANKAYGSLIVGLIRGLKKDRRLDVSRFPSLECFLASVTRFCEFMKGQGCESDYDRVCKAVGKRLFKNKSKHRQALESSWARNWWNNCDEDVIERLDDEDKDNNDGKPWYYGGTYVDEDLKDPDFSRERVWKEYKDHLRGSLNCPCYGPPYWDLTRWSEDDKRPFLYSTPRDGTF
ncbi:hypothetical protein VKT23_001832 [Stygiomarasmius scandens]|uniref:Uncharacterized protein n=1 Tax=Marasmiellus scandens TaxID=2682957 RepID=A0ABR1K256_9AGAR